MDISDKHLGICHGGDGRKKSMGSTEGTEVGVTYERYDRGKNLHKQSKRFLQTLTLLECDTWTMVGSAVSCHPAVGQFYFSNLSKEMNPHRYLES